MVVAGDGKRRSDRRQRTATIAIRLTAEERARIEVQARNEGYNSIAEFGRTRLLGGRELKKKDFSSVIGQLGRIGNNLNQLARKANETGQMDPAEIRETLSAIEAAARAVTGDQDQ